jgi:hypothetical protein
MRHNEIVAQTVVNRVGRSARARFFLALTRNGKLGEDVARFLTIPAFVVYSM